MQTRRAPPPLFWESTTVGWVLAATASLVILLIRIVLAAHQQSCGGPDSCSYFALGRSLSEKHVLLQNFIVSYQIPNLHLPLTGLEYWRSGPAFILLLAQPFGGVTLFSALIVTIFMGLIVAGAAYYTALKMTGDRTTAVFAYILCLSLPPLWEFSVPDSALCYGACIAWFLVLLGVEAHSIRCDLAAIGVAVAANFMRNDAPLLLFPLLFVLYLRLKRSPGERNPRGFAYAALLVGGFLLAMVPEMVLNHAILGSSMRGATWRMLFLRDLGHFADYKPLTLRGWLSAGPKALLLDRVKTLATIAHQAVSNSIGFAGIFMVGCFGWTRRGGRRESTAAFCVMLVVSVAAYGLLFPAVGQRAMLRTMVGLLPFAATLIAVGIRRIARTERMATALVCGCLFFYGVAGSFVVVKLIRESSASARAYAQISGLVSADGQPGTIMTAYPSELSAATRLPAIPIPSDGRESVRDAALAFNVRYAVARTNDEARWLLLDLNARIVAQIPGSQMVLLEVGNIDRHN